MRKFLCYDTNDAASGKIGVNSNGVLSPNATVPSTNGSSYQQLVTDSDGNAKWEDRLAYSDTVETDITGKSYQSGTRSSSNTMTFAEPIPFEMGQKWKVFTTNTENGSIKEVMDVEQPSKEVLFEVQESDDGTLYIGAGLYPFCIYADHAEVNAAWASMSQVGTIKVVCISGVITEKVVKTIDPKYIKDMYYDNLQSASYAIYTAGAIPFPRNDGKIDIPLEMWKLLLDENATITDETTGSVMTNRTVVESAYGEAVHYDTGLPNIGLDISTIYPQAYLLDGTKPDGQFGEKRTINVSIGTIKKIDQKFIPNMTVIVNITDNEDGTYSADKTYDEIKSLIDSGIDVKCMYNSTIANYVGFNEEVSVMAFELTSFAADGVSISIFFIPDSISVNFTTLEKKLLPEVSTSDNNKFLSVVNGTWQASSDLIVPSSTSGSSKKFKITVDDSGAITATEV